jgi:hypothetical protein
MAHFAKIEDGYVREVIVVRNEDAPDDATGKEFIASIGLDGEWIQTSYNGNFRGRFAGSGYKYDPIEDKFISPFEELTE